MITHINQIGKYIFKRMYTILQGKVRQNYNKLIDDSYWKIIHTDNKTQDEVFEEIQGLAQDTISKEKSDYTETLWPMSESID